LWKSLDEEKRKLSLDNARMRRSLNQLRAGKRKLEDGLKEERKSGKLWKKKYEQEREKNEELEKKIRELEKQRDRYRDMVFKPNCRDRNDKAKEGNNEVKAKCSKREPKKKGRGGQPGHKGYGRTSPPQIDEEKRIYLEKCPVCDCKLNRSKTTKSHTVEDIPALEESRVKVVRYETEVQWCPNCKKVVKGRASGVIPRSRLGLNVLLYVLVHKYKCRQPWEVIVFNLANWYGLKVSKGNLVRMMHRARDWLGERYDQLLEDIRGSTVKYADETSWRLDGINHWLWGFFTDRHAYYRIEESRGKGVPEKIFEGSHPEDVLVRDDYAAYMKLPLLHQSCWAHLLRGSHERADRPDALTEVRLLHKKLKNMFSSLQKIVQQPFTLSKRKVAYSFFKKQIQQIIDSHYQHEDSKEIQNRISNQKTNLITALLHENVPLTNNHSERNIRCFVVARKISGGSRSKDGAKTHAILMSIIQTINLQREPLLPTLKKYLLYHSSAQN
jgi:transposase